MAKAKAKSIEAESSNEDYTVVARRYRPQQFSDLVGQESVARALMNAIQSGRVAHAYLFTGVRGVGKTSAARIFAKALNCVNGPTTTPCDQCDICRAIMDGQDVDVVEIDGASNTSVEDAREIRQNVATRPQRARFKIYIIDEVHMLTRNAFNALLKTMEEPPPHVKFILATTEVQKIPLTILSRCQRFDFGGITVNRIIDQLRQIVSSEKLQADDEALRIVARRAGGSMRDAQSLLEQLLSFGGERLTAEAVHELLGTAADDRVIALATAIVGKDLPSALGIVAKCCDEGLQVSELTDQLIAYWRGLMLSNATDGQWADLEVAEDHRNIVLQQARSITLDTILAGLDVLSTTKTRLRNTSHGQVVLEVAIARLCRLDELVPLAQLAQWYAQPGAAPPPTTRGPQSLASAAEPGKKNALTSPATGLRPSTVANSNGTSSPAAPKPLSVANLLMVWDNVKAQVGAMLAGELAKAGSPAIVGPKALALRFPSGYNHSLEYCKDPTRAKAVESALKSITGEEWGLRFDLDAAAPAAPTATLVSARERERRALELPLLQRIVSEMGGRLLNLQESFGEGQPAETED